MKRPVGLQRQATKTGHRGASVLAMKTRTRRQAARRRIRRDVDEVRPLAVVVKQLRDGRRAKGGEFGSDMGNLTEFD